MILVVVGYGKQVERRDPPLAEQVDDLMGGPRVDQGRLALGRADEDRVPLAHVENAE